MHSLDFNKVPDFSYTKAFKLIEAPILSAMAKLPETLERAQCAVYFSYGVCSQTDDRLHIRHGYMRASLAEFVGMEESLARDLGKLGIPQPPLKANSGVKPLLHIVRELRNFELHLHSSRLSSEKRPAIWGGRVNPEDGLHFEHTIWLIDDLTEAGFRKLRNAARYLPTDIPKLINWFNSAQREWGVHDLLMRAAEEFCREIIAEYSL